MWTYCLPIYFFPPIIFAVISYKYMLRNAFTSTLTTIGYLIPIMIGSAFLMWRRKLYGARWLLWILMLAFPFPYIANTAGWMTAELGRQPWLVYGLMKTLDGTSQVVSAGNSLFTLLGFLGLYFVVGVLFLMLLVRRISLGPAATRTH